MEFFMLCKYVFCVGTSADWWSVGVILFELIVGIPPFNAEHPQIIFDNILNRNIHWPQVPEEMSPEEADLVDRLLTEDPNQRLGAGGASEVKQHPFSKDINWDTLARQKTAFVPASESPMDTSYFTSRFSWNPSMDEFAGVAEFESGSSVNYSFSNFSFKWLNKSRKSYSDAELDEVRVEALWFIQEKI